MKIPDQYKKKCKCFLKKHHRWGIIIITAILEILFIIIFWSTFNTLLTKEWTKPLITMLFAAPVAFWLWFFKNHDRQRDINHHERDLTLKENNDVWNNLVKFQDIINDKTASDAKKATAILGLGEFYNHKDFKFVRQVHTLFKVYLKEFWKNNANIREYETAFHKNESINLPEYIKAIHEVIQRQSNEKLGDRNFFHQYNDLSFDRFQLQFANLDSTNLEEASFEYASLYCASLSNVNLNCANLQHITLNAANLEDTNLKEAQLQDAHLVEANLKNTDLTHANLYAADLSGTNLIGAKLLVCGGPSNEPLQGIKLHGAKYCDFTDRGASHTHFPAGFSPEQNHMILVDESENKC